MSHSPIGALEIRHSLQAPLVFLNADAAARINSTLAAVELLAPITSPETLAAADRVYKELHAFDRELERQRKSLKEPVLAIGRAIDGTAQAVSERIAPAKRSLGVRIATYQSDQERIADAAKRQAEDASRKAQEEADAQAQKDLAEKRARLQAAAAALGEDIEPEPAAEPTSVTVVPAYVAPAPKSTAVTMRSVQELIINDEEAIPVEFEGVLLRPVDQAALRRLLLAGKQVPGAELVTVEVPAARGIR